MKKVVFIIGASHSGSTLLDLILGSHSHGFSIGEFNTFPRNLKEKGFSTSICGVCGDNCSFWNQSVSLPIIHSYFQWGASKNPIKKRLYEHFGSFKGNIYDWLFQWSGASVLIDSSKTVGWVRRQLRPFWYWWRITPFLLYIHRDGRAVVNSLLRKHPQKGIKNLTKTWVKVTIAMEAFFHTFPQNRKLTLSYEGLATNPESTIKAICQVLGLAYEPSMLLYWQHQHHHVQGNWGTRSLILKYREQFKTEYPRPSLINQAFYDQIGLAIKPDIRWRDELSQKDLEIFNSIAGNLNKKYAFEPDAFVGVENLNT